MGNSSSISDSDCSVPADRFKAAKSKVGQGCYCRSYIYCHGSRDNHPLYIAMRYNNSPSEVDLASLHPTSSQNFRSFLLLFDMSRRIGHLDGEMVGLCQESEVRSQYSGVRIQESVGVVILSERLKFKDKKARLSNQ